MPLEAIIDLHASHVAFRVTLCVQDGDRSQIRGQMTQVLIISEVFLGFVLVWTLSFVTSCFFRNVLLEFPSSVRFGSLLPPLFDSRSFQNNSDRF